MKKLLSMLLSAVVFVCAIGTVYADADISAGETTAVASEEAYRVSEVTELREANSETYLLSDGTYECVVYAGNKYYQDENGEYIEISNKIVAEEFAGKSKTYGFANEANDVKVYFSEKEASVLIASDGNELSFTLVREGKADSDKILKEAEDKTEISETSDAVKVSVGEKSSDYGFEGFGLNGESSISYAEVLEGTDVVYTVGTGYVKEYIVLKDQNAPSEFSFELDTENYAVKQGDDGTVGIYDTDGNQVFELGSLFAVDSNENYTESVKYAVHDDGNGTTVVSISVDEAWLNDKERAFPVLVDPTVTLEGSSSTFDTYVSSRYPNQNYNGQWYRNSLITGYNGNSRYRTYIRFNLPSYLYDNPIRSAELKIKSRTNSTPQIKAYRVLRSWDSNTLTWNNQPTHTTSACSDYPEYEGNNWYTFNVCSIVKKWCSGSYANNGFLLRQYDEYIGRVNYFYSSDAETDYIPELHIKYGSKITIDRLSSEYSEISTLAAPMRYQQNCYGYALQVYSLYVDAMTGCYLQVPGEFADDGALYADLKDEYNERFNKNGLSPTEQLDFIQEKIYADFQTLRAQCGSEWKIKATTLSASVPSGWRKIALVLKSEGKKSDFHFLMRHSDGTWSHKQGNYEVTNLSIDTGVPITDGNFATTGKEGGYNDGMRFYLIKKSALIDYPHYYGHLGSTCTYTPTGFSDKAGQSLDKSETLTTKATELAARFDSWRDVDCYAFTPSKSGSYTFSVTTDASSTDIDMIIYDTYGDPIASDTALGNPNILIYLSSGTRYFIKVYDYRDNVTTYNLYYSR